MEFLCFELMPSVSIQESNLRPKDQDFTILEISRLMLGKQNSRFDGKLLWLQVQIIRSGDRVVLCSPPIHALVFNPPVRSPTVLKGDFGQVYKGLRQGAGLMDAHQVPKYNNHVLPDGSSLRYGSPCIIPSLLNAAPC